MNKEFKITNDFRLFNRFIFKKNRINLDTKRLVALWTKKLSIPVQLLERFIDKTS